MRAALIGVLGLTLAASANAHSTGGHDGFVAAVSGVEPPLPGLVVQVAGGHERLLVRNLTQKTVRFSEPGIVLRPGEAATWEEPRIGPTEPPEREGLVRTWRVPASADGEPLAIVGFLGYAGPVERDSALPAWALALAAGGGGLVLAAVLALPLLRRKGEDRRRGAATEP